MRDYLYFHHDPKRNCLTASGIEFKDVVKYLASVPKQFPNRTGYVIVKHQSNNIKNYVSKKISNYNAVQLGSIGKLLKEDIYSFGDFEWLDFDVENPPCPSILKTCVKNKEAYRKFYCIAHDDGFIMKLYYTDGGFYNVQQLIKSVCPYFLDIHSEQLQQGIFAFYCKDEVVTSEIRTDDINKILERNNNG
jgi:hypothetical protein